MVKRWTGSGGASAAGFSVQAAAAVTAAVTRRARAKRHPVPAARRGRERRSVGGARLRNPDSSASPVGSIHCSSRLRSRIVCQRSSGSLARQVLTTRSSRRGMPGSISRRGAGASLRIAPMTLAWLSASNGRRPDTIS